MDKFIIKKTIYQIDKAELNRAIVERIRERIRELRIERNMSQEDLARKISMSRQNLCNLENCKFYLTVQALYEICFAFEIQPRDILPDLPYKQKED